jgi:hypothetical protein
MTDSQVHEFSSAGKVSLFVETVLEAKFRNPQHVLLEERNYDPIERKVFGQLLGNKGFKLDRN